MINYKNYVMLFVASLAAIIMRIVMAFFITDYESGFIRQENLAAAVFIIVIILIAATMIYVFAFFDDVKKIKAPTFKGVGARVISVLLGVSIIIDLLRPKTDLLISSWQINVDFIVSITFVAFLTLTALAGIKGIEAPQLLTLVPVVFWLVRLVTVFTSYSTVSNTVDNLFELFTNCVILVFFSTYSKAVCLAPSETQIKKLNGIAYLACFMSFVTAIPKAVIIFSSNSQILHQNNQSFLTILFTGIYILIFIINNNKRAID